MSKIVLNPISNISGNPGSAETTLNANFAEIQEQIDLLLSRDDEEPNQLEANLDVNSNRLLNLAAPLTPNEPARLRDVQAQTTGATASLIQVTDTPDHYTGENVEAILEEIGAELEMGFYGSGSPEGVVTAPIGAIYLRTDANSQGQFYNKASGTGNTGWIVLPFYGQTLAESQASVTPTSYFYLPGNVLRYGALGDGSTDDTVAFQKAFDQARYSKGKVIIPNKNLNGTTVYRANTITVYSDTEVVGETGVIVENNSGTSIGSNYVFKVFGNLGTGTALTANTVIAQDTVAVTSASGLSVGQIVLIREQTFVNGAGGQTLELNQITNISSLTITLLNKTANVYTTAASAELVPFTNPRKNIKFYNIRTRVPVGAPATAGGFYIEYAWDCHVIDCHCSGMTGMGVIINRSRSCRISGGSYTEGATVTTPGTSYGYLFQESSFDCVAHHVETRLVRENAIAWGCKMCGFENNVDIASNDTSWNTHASGSVDCWIEGNTSHNCEASAIIVGFASSGNPGDRRIRVVDNKIYYPGRYGIACYASDTLENYDVMILDNYIKGPAWDTATTEAIFVSECIRPTIDGNRIDGEANTNIRAGIVVENSTDAVIRSNRVRDLPAAWGIYYDNCTGVEISDNTIETVSSHNIRAHTTPSTNVRVFDNRGDDVTYLRGTDEAWFDNLNYMQGSATYDPASMIDGAGVTTTVTCTGAQLGDEAVASFSLDLQSILLTAYVSAANTVTVRFQNETGSTIDLGSGTIRVNAYRKF